MFDCSRVPGPEGVDWSVSYAKEGDIGESGHIVVFRKGRVWKLEPWQNGHLLSVEEIEKYVLVHSAGERISLTPFDDDRGIG